MLIVDDNEHSRDGLACRLELDGYDVVTMESAAGIVERIGDAAVDLVLLDVEMPGISGLDALVAIREVYSAVQLPVIMVTGHSQSEDIVKALELGANDYVGKPIDFPVTLARVRTHISHLRAKQALRASEERYALAALGANDGLWDWNLREDTMYFSARWKSMLGYADDEIGDSPEEWFERIHEADRPKVTQIMEEHLVGRSSHFEVESRMRHKDGVYRWMMTRGLMVTDANGSPLRMAGSQRDITDGKVADAMTGLPNRLLLLDRLAREIARQQRHPETLFGVLFIDLDGFKFVNDSLGHAIGDKLLVLVASRLERSMRHSDTVARVDKGVTIARLGGDEFAIILTDLQQPEDAVAIAQRLIDELSRPFLIDGKELFTSMSIGIALSTLGHERPDDYLRDADTAMYRAKGLGKGRCEVFDANMRKLIIQRLEIENDLRRALERGEFCNYYQPIVSLESGAIASFEALLRWEHPTRGLLEPSEFIPIAEESGLIRELGWWALEEACERVWDWRALHPSLAGLTVSVNLSVKQFADPDFGPRLEALISDSRVPEGSLKLELTESSLMGDPVAAVALLTRFKTLGVSLAIDDFGMGYSSLSYLHRFPLDTLKIDRSFTDAIRNDPKQASMISRTIMPLAHHLGLEVIAEGVETVEQATVLRDLRCKYAQGFLFSRPIKAEDVAVMLTNAVNGTGAVGRVLSGSPARSVKVATTPRL